MSFLGRHLGYDGHAGRDRGAHGIGDSRGGLELWRAQGGLDVGRSLVKAPSAPTAAQGGGDLGARKTSSQRGSWGHPEHF